MFRDYELFVFESYGIGLSQKAFLTCETFRFNCYAVSIFTINNKHGTAPQPFLLTMSTIIDDKHCLKVT